MHFKNQPFDDYYKNIFLSNPDAQNLITQSISISSLERLGLVSVNFEEKVQAYKYDPFEYTELYNQIEKDIVLKDIPRATYIEIVKGIVELTPYGELFIKSCVK